MAFGLQVGQGLNPFIPSYNWTDQGVQNVLRIDYSRNPNDFDVLRWTKLMTTKQMLGVFQRMDPTNGTRVVNVNDYIWPLGNDMPRGQMNFFENATFACARYADPWWIPIETAEQSGNDEVAGHVATHAMKMMTIRTINAVTVAATAGNWPAANYKATATLLGGGAWLASSAANGWIKKGIQAAMQAVRIATGGLVKGSELIMVISPEVAIMISQTEEFKDFVKQSPDAAAIQRGDPSVVIPDYGIPRRLYGLRDIIVESSVRTTSQQGATVVSASILGNGVLFITRRGDLVGAAGQWDWSTIQCFSYKDLAIKSQLDTWNERIQGAVMDNYVFGVVAPQSGLYCADVTA